MRGATAKRLEKERDQSSFGWGISRASRAQLRLIFENEQARAKEPHDRLAARFVQRAIRLWPARRFEDAIAACGRAIELEPDYGWAHAVRGGALFEAGRFEEALAASERALELEPGLGWAYTIRAAVYCAFGRYDEAVAASEQAVEIEPDFSWGHITRGAALCDLGRNDEAIAACDRAIELQPDLGWAHTVRAAALYDLRRNDEVIAACGRAIEYEPDFAWVHGLRGAAFYRVDRYEEAIAACSRALELDPDFWWARERRATALDRAIEVDPYFEIDPYFEWTGERRNAAEAEAEDITRFDESNKPGYTVDNAGETALKGPGYGYEMGETAEFRAAARTFSDRQLKEYVEKGEVAAAVLRERETTGRATAAPRPEAAAGAASPGPAWPTEKWKGSPEELSRKRYQIIAFLRRVWKPFIDNNNVVVTRKILAEKDVEAALALKGYLRAHEMPNDIRILSDKRLKQEIARRPITLAALRT